MLGIIVEGFDGGVVVSVPVTPDGSVRINTALEIEEAGRLAQQLNTQLVAVGLKAYAIESKGVTVQALMYAWTALRAAVVADENRHGETINWALSLIDQYGPKIVEEDEDYEAVDGSIYSVMEAKRQAAGL